MVPFWGPTALSLVFICATSVTGLVNSAYGRNGPMTNTMMSTLSRLEAATTDSSVEIHSKRSTEPIYGSIQHCGVLVRDTAESLEFYKEAFGFLDETHLRNPKLPYKGGWLRAGSSQIHLMELPNPDPVAGRPDHGGRDRHLALTCAPGTLELIKARLTALNRAFTMSQSGRPALFCRDLDGNTLEFIEQSEI